MYYWFVPNNVCPYINNGRWLYDNKNVNKFLGYTMKRWKYVVERNFYTKSRSQKILLKYYVGPEE